MKRYLLTAILILVSCSLFAACGSNDTIANAMISCVSGLSNTPANVTAVIWIQGLYNAADATGTDSTGVPSVEVAPCGWAGDYVLASGPCNGDIAGNYLVYADWLNATYDGCPTNTGTERAVLLAYDNTGAYTLQSRLRSEDWTNWDAIGTIAAAIPTFDNTPAGGGVATRTGATTADITFPAIPASVYNGSYAGAAPGSPVATGYRIYAWQGASGPTTIAISGGWTVCNGGAVTPIATNTLSGIAIPAAVGGQGIMFSRSLVFDGLELPFVSNSLLPLTGEVPSGGATISGLSAVKSGLNTLVSWTSSDESQVTGYQVFWAPQGGQFSAVGSIVSPTGNNSDYTASVRIPATSSFTVKVGAFLTNGEMTYSAPASVKATNIIHDKTRVNID